ncbi:MAG: hypothetical protein ABS81_27245 [Pseudonocardia sp. SCN 72-86]|nr:MAG: hypothetical protein ABS81_27245 [Pseudonocardia sp. SCN 72-86]
MPEQFKGLVGESLRFVRVRRGSLDAERRQDEEIDLSGMPDLKDEVRCMHERPSGISSRADQRDRLIEHGDCHRSIGGQVGVLMRHPALLTRSAVTLLRATTYVNSVVWQYLRCKVSANDEE